MNPDGAGSVKYTKKPQNHGSPMKGAADLGAQGSLCDCQQDGSILAMGTPWVSLGISTVLWAPLQLCCPQLPAQGMTMPQGSFFTERPCPEVTPIHISLHLMLQSTI